ncbi:MAG: lanthionine synthetase [Kutzneria sp.]|nr:lanthionine synthetase [Kutzneria sp.]
MTADQPNDQLALARTLYQDAAEGTARQPTFPLLLDHAVMSLEFSRALGEDFDPETPFHAALDLLNSASEVGPWLYRGAAQAGWTAIQLARFRGVRATGLSPIDDTVLGWLSAFPDHLDVDLPMGALGLGVYGLAHPDAAVREKLTSGVLDVIEARTEQDQHGLFVRLCPSPARLADSSAGCRMVGVAHGTAGLVSYLASVVTSGLSAQPRARLLLDETLRWLRAQRTDVGATIFPHRVEAPDASPRATWCSGDPGVALALSVAARATGSAEVSALAREVAAAVLARPQEDCGVVDACICHGAAGLCWFGHRARTTFGAPAADAVVAQWSRYLAEQRSAGHLTYFGPNGMERNFSFLEGDGGVALVLLYAATGVQPCWEDLVLAVPITAVA